MLMPSIFGENLFDDFMDDFAFPDIDKKLYGKHAPHIMKTDVKEKDNAYEVTIDLPGFKKEDIKGEIKDGYLVITASTNTENEDKDEDGKYIRRERYSGTCSRSFYVGEDVKEDDIKAKFEDGTLKVVIPKKEEKHEVEQAKYIAIEG